MRALWSDNIAFITCLKKLNVPGASLTQQVLNPTPLNPHPCNMAQAKTEVALQFSECCAAEVALMSF